MSIPVAQLGWLAGILDLKGSIIRKNNKQRASSQIVLMVETRHSTIIRQLSRMTGTTPEFQPEKPVEPWMRRGCIEHCPEQHVHVAYEKSMMPAVARWTVTGVALAIVLYNVLPFLHNDDKPFMEAMEMALGQIVPDGQGRAAIDRAIRRLQDLGWEIPTAVYPEKDEQLSLDIR